MSTPLPPTLTTADGLKLQVRDVAGRRRRARHGADRARPRRARRPLRARRGAPGRRRPPCRRLRPPRPRRQRRPARPPAPPRRPAARPGAGDRRGARGASRPAGAARPQHGRGDRGAHGRRRAGAEAAEVASRRSTRWCCRRRRWTSAWAARRRRCWPCWAARAELRDRQRAGAGVGLARPGRRGGLHRRPAGARPRLRQAGALHGRCRRVRARARGAVARADAADLRRRRPLRRAGRQRGLREGRAGVGRHGAGVPGAVPRAVQRARAGARCSPCSPTGWPRRRPRRRTDPAGRGFGQRPTLGASRCGERHHERTRPPAAGAARRSRSHRRRTPAACGTRRSSRRSPTTSRSRPRARCSMPTGPRTATSTRWCRDAAAWVESKKVAGPEARSGAHRGPHAGDLLRGAGHQGRRQRADATPSASTATSTSSPSSTAGATTSARGRPSTRTACSTAAAAPTTATRSTPSLTAIMALDAQGIPRPRCVGLIESCEESGSFDLPAYLDALKPRLGNVSLVVCLDSGAGNYDQLWLTTSLRGMVSGVLKVEILTEGVHSGDVERPGAVELPHPAPGARPARRQQDRRPAARRASTARSRPTRIEQAARHRGDPRRRGLEALPLGLRRRRRPDAADHHRPGRRRCSTAPGSRR